MVMQGSRYKNRGREGGLKQWNIS